MSAGKWCPFIQKNCKEHKCALYTNIQGYNSNTGQEMNQWGCSLTFLPMLSIEIAAKQNLITANKKDSQGLCFIGKVRLPDFLQQ